MPLAPISNAASMTQPTGRLPRLRAALLMLVVASLLAAPSAFARTFVLDGDLSEWGNADRMDAAPGMGVGGYELYGYHDATAHKYHLAIVAPMAIGPSTTVWINTDNDTSTGYLVWGALVGAEYNVNIAWDGAPHLYSGADGETWQIGPLSHAYSADKQILELELTEGMVGAGTPISLWLDVNNAVFLPSWFGGSGYVVDAVGIPAPPADPNGAITLDGDLSDWTAKDRIDRLPGMGVLGYEVYGRADGQTYYLALRALPPAAPIGAQTTFWLNTDRNRSTGYLVWGIAVGAELNVNVAADGTPHLYSGAAAENWLVGPLPHAYGEGGNVLEIAVSQELVGAGKGSIDVSVDVNNLIFLPADFTGPGHTLYHPVDLPERDLDAPRRVGIVFSQTTQNAFFHDKGYAQLYTAMQHQAMLAGVPTVLLHETDLLDINKIKDLRALVFPYFANVEEGDVATIEDVLIRAVHHYGIGIIAAGNFMTNDPTGAALPGDSYARMKKVLGLTLHGYFGPMDHTLTSLDGHRMLKGYAAGEQLGNYPGGYMLYYKRYDSVAQPLAMANTASSTQPAIWATTAGARSVHFASPSVIGDTDLASRAIAWSVDGDGASLGLLPTRDAAIFIGRCDMDQSQYIDEVTELYPLLMDVIGKWKNELNFVSSYYVNVGNNVKEGETTDWNFSLPIYQQLMEMGNEIGTHSYTHPHYTTDLTASQLQFEFQTSRDVIASKIGVPVVGAAVPGNPESLAVDAALAQWFSYVTADFSGLGAGYHGAMGLLHPDDTMVYLAPNLYFDFTMLSFLQYTPDQSLQTWTSQYDALTKHARGAFVVWPWHDYGPTGYEGAQYQEFVFTGLLEHAAEAGAEFVTAAKAAARVQSFRKAEVRTSAVDDATIIADVQGDAETGAFALSLDLAGTDQRVVASVDGWPAWNDGQVLLGEGTRTYVVRLGRSSAAEAHITKLPMRASLLDAQTVGTELRFTFRGAGDVTIALPASDAVIGGRCGNSMAVVGRSLVISFGADAVHSCAIDFGR
ncbi:MAG: polysaccharide deacetylase family protein [Deltaproteobacteria bacterium]|nr:polysaccharide deacetylase family protein [Deltaproteobacteria bacterium]